MSEAIENEEIIEDNDVIEETESQEYEESDDSGVELEADSVEELHEEIEEAVENGASKEEVQSMIKEFSLKVNGREIKTSIDLSDEDEVKRQLQLAYAGRDALQESAELKKVLGQSLKEWKTDPSKFFKEIGMDEEEYAKMVLQSKIEEFKKTPEQREREQMQLELEDARKQLNDQKEKIESERYNKLVAEESQKLEDDMVKALDAHSSLPATARTFRQIADTMAWAMDNGYENVTVEEVIPTVEAEMRKEFDEILASLGDEALEAFLGQKTLGRLRNKRIKKAKTVPSASNLKNEIAKVERKEEKKVSKYKSFEDIYRQR